MNLVYQRFWRSVAWSTFESTIYHTVLCVHQIALFFCMPKELYGQIGMLFAMLYGAITLTNGGFDATLPLFFPSAITSKRHALFLARQLIPECVLMLGIILYGIRYSSFAGTESTLAIVLGLLLITEGIRKTMRSLLQLIFIAKETAFIELCSLVGYIGCIWLHMYYSSPLTALDIFLPMLISSLGAVSSKGYLLYTRWYRLLPTDNPLAPILSTRTIIIQRMFNYSTQLSHTLFSHNVIVPFVAFNYGFAPAASIKIISTILNFISLTIRKIFGVPSAALFANLRSVSAEEKSTACTLITRMIRQSLIIGLLACALVCTFVHYATITPSSLLTTPFMLLFAVLILSEHIFIAYELLFITEGKAIYSTAISIASLILMTLVFIYAPKTSPSILLLYILSIRALAYCCFRTLSAHDWPTQIVLYLKHFKNYYFQKLSKHEI